MSRTVLACLGGVARDRLAQPLEIVEFRLVAQLPQEAHAQPLPIELAIPVEEVHFEQRLRHRVHRRAAPDARDTAPEALDLDDVNAAQRRALRERDIRGGKAKLASQARALSDLAAHRVRPPKQPFGARKIARRERRAHGGARHSLAVERYVGHRFEREALPPGGVLERREVTLALRAEAEVAPYEQPPRAQPAQEHVLDEVRRAHRRKARVEVNQVHALDPGGGKELELVVQARKAGGRRIAGEEFARMRLEGQYAGGHAQLAALGHDALDERQMAAVHAVEVADGQRGAAPGAPQRAVRDHHGVVNILNYR